MPQNKTTIVFDCDDTLLNLRDPMMRMLNHVTCRSVHWEQWHHTDLHRHYGLTAAQLWRHVTRHRVLENATPEPGIGPMIAELRLSGFAIEAWTARGMIPGARRATENSLAPFGVKPHDIRIFPFAWLKIPALRMRSDVRFLVDDNPFSISRARRYQTHAKTMLVSRPWNLDIGIPLFSRRGCATEDLISRTLGACAG